MTERSPKRFKSVNAAPATASVTGATAATIGSAVFGLDAAPVLAVAKPAITIPDSPVAGGGGGGGGGLPSTNQSPLQLLHSTAHAQRGKNVTPVFGAMASPKFPSGGGGGGGGGMSKLDLTRASSAGSTGGRSAGGGGGSAPGSAKHSTHKSSTPVKSDGSGTGTAAVAAAAVDMKDEASDSDADAEDDTPDGHVFLSTKAIFPLSASGSRSGAVGLATLSLSALNLVCEALEITELANLMCANRALHSHFDTNSESFWSIRYMNDLGAARYSDFVSRAALDGWTVKQHLIWSLWTLAYAQERSAAVRFNVHRNVWVCIAAERKRKTHAAAKRKRQIEAYHRQTSIGATATATATAAAAAAAAAPAGSTTSNSAALTIGRAK